MAIKKMNLKNNSDVTNNSYFNLENDTTNNTTIKSSENELNVSENIKHKDNDNELVDSQNKTKTEKITLQSFKIDQLIGKGSFGKVFKVTRKDTNNT